MLFTLNTKRWEAHRWQGVLLFLLYFATAKIGLLLRDPHSIASLVWAPPGISLVALWMGGPRLWPGIFLGAFSATWSAGAKIPLALVLATGNTLEALWAITLLNQLQFTPDFKSIPNIFKFLIAVAISSLVSCSVGTTSLAFVGKFATFQSAAKNFMAWWLGDVMGELSLSPLLFILGYSLLEKKELLWNPKKNLEVLALVLVTLLVSGSTFNGLPFPKVFALDHPYFIFPLIIWTSFRFGHKGSAVFIFFLSILAIWGTFKGSNPFEIATPHERLFKLQIFLLMVILTSLLLSASLEERAKLASKVSEELEEKVKERTEELLRKEQLLVESERLAHLGCWEWDIDSNKIIWSDELYRIHNIAKSEFDGTYQGLLSKIHPDDREILNSTIHTAYSTQEGFSIRERIVRPDNTIRLLQSYGKVVSNLEGKPIRMYGACQDITEYDDLLKREKQARQNAEQATKTRDEVVAIVSHDLKNPLMGILASVAVLRKLPEVHMKGRRPIELIELSVKSMNQMIEDLLDVYKTEAGGYKTRVALERQSCEVLPIVQKFVELQQAVADAKKILIEIDLPQNLPRMAINIGLMGQVFQNLVGNALKFTSDCGKIRIAAREDKQMVLFSVQDTGPGIEESVISTLFDRFAQARKTARLGTGLGLVIAKGIVEAHGGRIWVESSINVGTTFYFTVPTGSACFLEDVS